MPAIISKRTATAVPIYQLVTRNGGITGLTLTFRLISGADPTEWMDFNDGLFKSAGHVDDTITLTEINSVEFPGLYVLPGGLDLSALTIPASEPFVLGRYDITAGGETGTQLETINFIVLNDLADVKADTASIINSVDVVGVQVEDGAISAASYANDAQLVNVYGGKVWIDTVAGSAGTTIGVNGLEGNPVDNLADAVTIATAIGTQELHVRGSITLNASFNGWRFVGQGSAPAGARIDLGSQNVDDSQFFRCELFGTQGGGRLVAYDGLVNDVDNLSGLIVRCGIIAVSNIAVSGTLQLLQCQNANAVGEAIFTMPTGVFGVLLVHDFSGGIDVRGMDISTHLVDVTMIGDRAVIDATCVDGTISIGGVANLTDNSGAGCTVIDALVKHDTTEDSLRYARNRLEVDFGVSPRQLVLYEDDATTEKARHNLTTEGGEDVLTTTGVQTKRSAPV